ncbi:membrane protein [Legionella norrlandica]|uniref:Membrane protein n=1 Tax=Legionella norrlandica TaxID=1498499 RepID=A0A0A2STI4_9GAMM|nr:DUF502 domain-containing protein [Legionella norrlandica]KGP64395.1 membrane protein [Legionella norrlandica]
MKSTSIRAYLIAGLIVWLPIFVTIVVLRFIIEMLDGTLALLPTAYQPEQLLGVHVPGLGVLFSLILLLVTGVVATNFLGQRLVIWGESLLAKIPLVRSIYNTAKQVIHAIFSTNSQAFRKAVLIEYPRAGLWTIAFQTGTVISEIKNKSQEDMMSVFVPTTPNPTSGFMLMLPRQDAIELDISIEEALKLVISLGVVQSDPALALPSTQ